MLIGACVSFCLASPPHPKGRLAFEFAGRAGGQQEEGEEDEEGRREGRLESVTRLCAERGRAGATTGTGNREAIHSAFGQ